MSCPSFLKIHLQSGVLVDSVSCSIAQIVTSWADIMLHSAPTVLATVSGLQDLSSSTRA